MKNFFLIVIVLIAMLMLYGCNKVEYDKIIGTKDYVTVTFKYGKNVVNFNYKIFQVYAVQRGKKIDFEDEPNPPKVYYKDSEFYGYHFNKAWSVYYIGDDYESAKKIFLSDYVFYEDATIYVDFYENFQQRKFYIVKNGEANLFYTFPSMLGNTEIYSFFSLNSDIVETDWGEDDFGKDPNFLGLKEYLLNYECSTILGWYYDMACTRPITFPINPGRYNGSDFDYYLKCE